VCPAKRNTHFDHEPVMFHNAVVRKSAHRRDGFLCGIDFGGRVVRVLLEVVADLNKQRGRTSSTHRVPTLSETHTHTHTQKKKKKKKKTHTHTQVAQTHTHKSRKHTNTCKPDSLT